MTTPKTATSIERPDPTTLSDGQLADNYFHWKALSDHFKPDSDYLDALGKEARRRCDDKPADRSFRFVGERATLEVGMRNTEKTLTSLYQLYTRSKLKIRDFLGKCKMSIGEAEQLPGADKLIEETRTGWRPLKAIPNVEERAA